MPKKTLTRKDRLRQDWLDHNKRYRHDTRLQLTYDDYVKWVFGKTSKRLVKSDKEPVIAKPSWANTVDEIPSVIGTGKVELGKNSMVERVIQGRITGEDANYVLAKAARVGLSTSKGCYQYITDETDIKTLGKKSQQL